MIIFVVVRLIRECRLIYLNKCLFYSWLANWAFWFLVTRYELRSILIVFYYAAYQCVFWSADLNAFFFYRVPLSSIASVATGVGLLSLVGIALVSLPYGGRFGP